MGPFVRVGILDSPRASRNCRSCSGWSFRLWRLCWWWWGWLLSDGWHVPEKTRSRNSNFGSRFGFILRKFLSLKIIVQVFLRFGAGLSSVFSFNHILVMKWDTFSIQAGFFSAVDHILAKTYRAKQCLKVFFSSPVTETQPRRTLKTILFCYCIWDGWAFGSDATAPLTSCSSVRRISSEAIVTCSKSLIFWSVLVLHASSFRRELPVSESCPFFYIFAQVSSTLRCCCCSQLLS